ncbi:peptidoglycan-binding protein LysM [Chelatococcus sambhunathii]|uniref:Peptidoglycan-binding protein LysM n=1 Tax=Chelatococcus sambhunathii TaxID=363953 RepID=A0ABU1DGY8_9HYPH|nr:peptidoglycan-binding protein LysM [Chelatococcus sambhunathii]MDR4307381.1 peptidoglycan-binding protein LysM [Chelatococcus sambhunathii]
MGVFDFIKDVGEKLFGASEASAAPADKIKEELKKNGLDSDKIDVKVEGDTVKINGDVASDEVRQKIIVAAGNTLGTAKVDENITVSGAKPSVEKFYTVKKGDTLSEIAQSQLGKASRYNEIFEANKPMLKHPDKIYPGQVLRIPA